ncbi:MAG: PAS domain S-box protein, partial [Syntrophobacteraceae bacterium]
MLLFIFLPADGAVIASGFSNQWILGTAALSAMLLAWLLGNFTFAAQIKPLVADVQLLGRGELGTRTGLPHTPDELGQLAKSFDEMASLVEMKSIERKRAEQALRESEVRYRTLFESASVAIFLILDDKFIDCNDAAPKMYGYTREELIGNYPYAISPPVQPNGKDSKEEAIKRMADVLSGAPQFFEWRHCRRDGTQFDAEVSLDRMELGNEVLILGIIRDITSRKQAQEALQQSNARICHLNDVLRAIRDAGRLINREKYPIELLKAVCDSLVETRGYVMVWIGKPEADSKRVLPVANAGGDMDFLQHAPITWDDSPTGQGPAGTAMRERRAVVFNDLATDSRFALRKDPVMTAGGASIASFPLIHAESLFGVLTVKADRPHAFDLEEVELLSNLAADLARALQNLENEVACKRAEEGLKDSEQQLRSVIQSYPLPAFVIGKDHKVIYWNKALEEMSKIRANEVVGTDQDWRAFYGTARPCMADLLVDEATPEVISHWYN